MPNKKTILIVGGGTAGWMTAAAMVNFLSDEFYSIKLVESEAIGTIGVGEATIPHIRHFNHKLGIDEREFMQATQATYKLGIEFSNWGKQGDAYIHPFGDYGKPINGIDFYQYWLKGKLSGDQSHLDDYSLPIMASKKNKFMFPVSEQSSVYSSFSYAYHLDATKYAMLLRAYAENKGVERIEGKVIKVTQNNNGNIDSVYLESEQEINADWFVDCSGFRGLLIEKTLQSGYEDWSEYLPCDRALAVRSEKLSDPLVYTKAIAHEAGWQFQIPLQQRTGNGYVFSSNFIKEEKVLDTLLNNLDGPAISEPKLIPFVTGKRNETWKNNCIAIGLSGGFLEPLESTSIYLIQVAINYLLELLPVSNVDSKIRADEFNRLIDDEYLKVRDFLILHYYATERTDTEFWNYCRTMAIPDSLQQKLELFKESGFIVDYKQGLFQQPSWLAVYFGQRVMPRKYDKRLDRNDTGQIKAQLANIKEFLTEAVDRMPAHEEFLQAFLNQELPEKMYQQPSMNLYGR